MWQVPLALAGALACFALIAPVSGRTAGQPVPHRVEVDAPTKLRQLEGEGRIIVDAIGRKDVVTVLRYFGDWGVPIGGDHRVSRQHIENQFRSKRGLIYAYLFDTQQLRSLTKGSSLETALSLHDHFRTARSIQIAVEDMMPWLERDEVKARDVPLWGRLILRWDGRPDDVGVYADPTFVYSEQGWKFSSFFTYP